MRVLMLTWEYPPHVVGGLSRHVCGLSRGLARQGLQVDVLTRSGPGAPDREEDGGVRVHRVHPYPGHPPDFPGWVMHLNFALAEAAIPLLGGAGEPVLLHAHDWLTAYAGRLLKHAFRLPLLATVHATESGRMGGLHHHGQKYIHDIEWWLTYEAWRVIACSRHMRQEVRRLFGLPDDKVRVVPNGIDLPDGTAAGAGGRAPGAAGDGAAPGGLDGATGGGPLVFHLGRLVPEKGAGVLLEAFPEVLAAFPGARLVIAGTGPWEGELRERARALGLGARVHFTGYLPEAGVQALYRRADVAVVPSTYEPFGIVALEAMAAGTPLVVSDTGGLGEIVTHGADGRKALPGNPGSLATQIKAVLADPAGARAMAAAARRTVARLYSWDGVALATRRVYGEVLAEWQASAWGHRSGRVAARWPAAARVSGAGPVPAPVTGAHPLPARAPVPDVAAVLPFPPAPPPDGAAAPPVAAAGPPPPAPDGWYTL